MSRSWEQYRDALRGIRLPLAYCDLDLFDRNARDLVLRARGRPLRVATKSVRCRALLERVGSFGGWSGLMCFAAGEAAFLAEHGFDDLLVAYPTLEESELAAVCEEVGRGRSITLMVDDPVHVERLGAVARRHGVTLGVCIDLDVSTRLPGLWFGVRRSPIRDAGALVALARRVADTGGLRLEGLMGYEAQIAGVPDAVPKRRAANAVIRLLKRRSAREVALRRRDAVEALRREGLPVRFVNGGGTGSLESTAADPVVTEATAGSGLFSPGLFDDYAGFLHLPAAGFALPVTRRPTADIVTCHGGGYVASGAAGPDRLPRPYLPEGAELLPLEGAGEVQTPVRIRGRARPGLGDPVFFRHAKAGELCERFRTLVLLSNGRVIDEVPTYRGDGRCFV